MRVYTLVFTTFSTKKLIVYHIFETGHFINGEKYAAKALSSVPKALKLGGHRDLFKVFSPHLLFILDCQQRTHKVSLQGVWA